MGRRTKERILTEQRNRARAHPNMTSNIASHEHRAIAAIIAAAPYEFTQMPDDGHALFIAACKRARRCLAESLRSYRSAGKHVRAHWLRSHAYWIGMPSKM